MTDLESQVRIEKRLRRVERKIDSVFDLISGIIAVGVVFVAYGAVEGLHWQEPWSSVAHGAAVIGAVAIGYSFRLSYPNRADSELD